MTRLLALVLALAVSRPYHHETVTSLAQSRHTHVQVAGTVTLVRREADGDIHFRIADASGHFVVCEILRTLIPVAALDHRSEAGPVLIEPPRVGQAVVVFGIRRLDNEAGHGWPEVHPVERWIAAVP